MRDRIGAPLQLDDRGAKLGFDLAGRIYLLPYVLEFEFALIEQTRLFAKARFKILGAPAENFGFLALRGEVLLEFGDAPPKIFNLAAFILQFLGGGLELDPLSIAAILDGFQLVAGPFKTLLQSLNLGL